MKFPARGFATFLLGCVLAGLAGALPADAASRQLAPLTLSDLAGKEVSVTDLRGKVVLLNFWATWCKPCITEMPILARVAERYRARGFQVVAASVDEADARDAVKSLAERMPAGMEVWVGATMADMQRLEVGEALPVSVLLDREGSVIRVHHGVIEEDSIDKLIESLLDSTPKERKKFPGVTEAAAEAEPPSTVTDECCDEEEGAAHAHESEHAHEPKHEHSHDESDADAAAEAPRSRVPS
ncbi:MAG: TlpA family protein disulfide reductase [Candidatus Binatia bacterium]